MRLSLELRVVGSLVAIAFAVAGATASCSGFDPEPVAPVPDGGGTGADGATPAPSSSSPPGPGPSDGGTPDAEAGAPTKTYLSCADAHRQGIQSDLDILVDVDGADGPHPPFTVSCVNMSSPSDEPDDYLKLPVTTDLRGANPANGSNVSVWRTGGTCGCSEDVIRAFTAVRLALPASPTAKPGIYVADAHFSTTSRDKGGCDTGNDGCIGFNDPADDYGVASGCNTTGPFGRGNVDLTGTPFHIASTEQGSMSGGGTPGTTTYSGDRKTATTTAGGNCNNQFADNQPGDATNTMFLDWD